MQQQQPYSAALLWLYLDCTSLQLQIWLVARVRLPERRKLCRTAPHCPQHLQGCLATGCTQAPVVQALTLRRR